MSAYKKRNPVRDPDLRRQYALSIGHCQSCGAGPTQCDFRGLSVHHIAKPGRSDELCNFLLLCGTCHDLAEGRNIRVPSTDPPTPRGEKRLLPLLPPAICCSLKKDRDPENWNLPRLLELWGWASLDLEPIPQEIQAMYQIRSAHRSDWKIHVELIEKPPPID